MTLLYFKRLSQRRQLGDALALNFGMSREEVRLTAFGLLFRL